MNTWHLNSDKPVYTRHPEPQSWNSTYAVLDFPDPVLRRFIAVHEAGHAVLYLASGIPVGEVHLCNDLGKGPGEGGAAWVKPGGNFSVPYAQYIAMCVAGERAQNRSLHEQGLWTPDRAWAVERLAADDRDKVAEALRFCNRGDLGFGHSPASGLDLAVVHRAADAALSHLWDRVLRLAEAVDEHGHLTGDQAARYADLAYVALSCNKSMGAAA
ncbi:hypothetical protein [Streptomyces luteireticuli]|uniref:Peptidase M41 domain-containing protein n=1 Tax=Streptomyces luteireticuli TaxID=173858 RepID=A0ABN0Z0L0_9ACTN